MFRKFPLCDNTKRQFGSYCLPYLRIDRRNWHPQSPDWAVRVFLLIPALLVKPTKPLEVERLNRLDQVDIRLVPFRTVWAVPQLAAVACQAFQ